MTWYINVVKTPQLSFYRPRTTIIINDKFTTPGTYKVDKGANLKIGYAVLNKGAAGQAKVVLRDKNTGEVYFQNTFNIGDHGHYQGSGSITVNNSVALQFLLYYWNGSTWVQCDEYG